jgi:CBS domain-containing protein
MLHVCAPHALGVLEPAPRGGECLVHGDADVFVVLVVDRDLATGDLQVQARDELPALVLVTAGQLHRDAAAYDVRMEALEMCGALANDLVELCGMRQVAQGDLNGEIHAPSVSAVSPMLLIKIKIAAAVRRTMNARQEIPMAIADICNRDVVTLFPKDTVADAARLMREKHVGSLVVIRRHEGDRPVAMFTDRDIAVGVVALGLDPDKTLVEAVMRPSLLCVRETDSIGLAAAIMRDQGVRRLPVVDEEGLLVGLIAADDLLDLLAGEVSDLATIVSRGMRREAKERAAAI